MILGQIESEFLRYLLARGCEPGSRLPALEAISAETGLSVGKLREQLEVARALGLVEVSPRKGIRCRGYEFLHTVRLGLMIALSLDRRAFKSYSVLRVHLEAAFWDEAVALLTPEDCAHLGELVARAQEKLHRERVLIPHSEHRELHMTLFGRLQNPFVLGLLEAYWEAYEAVEFNTYADYTYLRDVWNYHERIVEAIATGEFSRGKELLVEHHGLLDRMGNSHEAPNDRTAGELDEAGAGTQGRAPIVIPA